MIWRKFTEHQMDKDTDFKLKISQRTRTLENSHRDRTALTKTNEPKRRNSKIDEGKKIGI